MIHHLCNALLDALIARIDHQFGLFRCFVRRRDPCELGDFPGDQFHANDFKLFQDVVTKIRKDSLSPLDRLSMDAYQDFIKGWQQYRETQDIEPIQRVVLKVRSMGGDGIG